MSITPLHADALPAPRFFYTPCVKAGPFYQVSGMIGLDPATGFLQSGGTAAQTTRILENLRAALPEFGLGFGDLMIARIFTTRFERFAEINAAWESFFRAPAMPSSPPARTSVGVAALPLDADIEIEFCFYKE
jgi:2-iminobutanoate/2-iminopropanoate deaminase